MKLEDLRKHCMLKRGVTEEYPFDEVTVVFKVNGKMFALSNVETFNRISVKCDPDDASAYREAFVSVEPGYHLNKKHWNSIYLNGDVSDEQILQWVDESWEIVAASFSKKIREELGV